MKNGIHDATRRRPRRRTAAAALELALLLPLLLLLVLGCVDFGRVAYYSAALNNALASGSDFAATHRFTAYTQSTWEANVREVVMEEIQHLPEFSAADVDISVQSVTAPDQSVRVTIRASYPFRTAVAWPGVPGETMLVQYVTITQYR